MDKILKQQTLFLLEDIATAGEVVDLVIEALSDMDADDAKEEVLMLICNENTPKLNKELLDKIAEQEYLLDKANTAYQLTLKE